MDDEIKDYYQLWKSCFGDTKEYMDFYFKECMKDNKVLSLYEGQILTSMLHLNPYVVMCGNQPYVLHYIVGVATEPSYRRQGRMKSLIQEAFAIMRESGEPFTYLMPADEGIYLPFDFRFSYIQTRVKISLDKISLLKRKDSVTILPWNECSEGQKDEICSLTTEILQLDFNCFVKRTISYYERIHLEMMASGGELLVLYKKGHLIGILSFMSEKGEVEVTEFVCKENKSEDIINEVVWYLYHKNKTVLKKMEFLDTKYVKIPNVLCKSKDRKPIIMIRIIDIEAFFQMLPGTAGEEYVIQVADEWIAGNNGVFHIFWTEEGGQTKRLKGQAKEKYNIAELFQKFQDRFYVYLNEIV